MTADELVMRCSYQDAHSRALSVSDAELVEMREVALLIHDQVWVDAINDVRFKQLVARGATAHQAAAHMDTA